MDRETVLMVVVEDELWGAERLRLGLSLAGFQVAAAHDWQVKEMVDQNKPELLIVNLSGSQAADLDLCSTLSRISPAPMIAISSSDDEQTVVSLLEQGVDDYLVRPVDQAVLVARVRSILRRKAHFVPAAAPSSGHVPLPVTVPPSVRLERPHNPVNPFHRLWRWVKQLRAGRGSVRADE